MKKIKQTYLRSTYITLAILVLFMVAGSIWDLQISKWIYPGHENSIGQFFAGSCINLLNRCSGCLISFGCLNTQRI